MLGTSFAEKENVCGDEISGRYNNKLIKAYKKTCENYYAACERCDKLSDILNTFKLEKAIREESENMPKISSYTETIMEQMVREAYREKSLIAAQAMEYIKHLRSLKYEM